MRQPPPRDPRPGQPTPRDPRPGQPPPRDPRPRQPPPRGPRIGLGTDRVDPEWARFTTVADLIQYLCDLHSLTQTELADRCGLRREQLSRWLGGVHQPNLGRLVEVLDELGWTLVLSLARGPGALEAMSADPPALDFHVQRLLDTVRVAGEQGLDVVVGGEVAAVLQGVPVPTRQLVLHVRPEQREGFLRLAARRRHTVMRLDGRWVVRDWPVSADVLVTPVLPASRLVSAAEEAPVAVVDLDELLSDPGSVGPSVRAVAAGTSTAESIR